MMTPDPAARAAASAPPAQNPPAQNPPAQNPPAPASRPAPADDVLPRKSPLTLAWEFGASELVTAGLGLVAVLVAGLGAGLIVPSVIALLLVGALLLLGRRFEGPLTGSGALGRILLLMALGAAAGTRAVWAAAVVASAAVVVEVVVTRLRPFAVPLGVNLPGLRPPRPYRLPAGASFGVDAVALLLLAGLTIARAPGLVGVAVAGAALVVSGLHGVETGLQIVARRRADRRVGSLVSAYAPRFALHWDAAAGTGYQIGRWTPFLDRLGEHYVVIVRNPASFAEAVAATGQPVLLRRGARELDPVMAGSLRAVFYVNNSLQNVHAVRYPGLRHIQLNHGDSDKATSYSPVFRMFDRNFVAGQAAVDRFADHGVSTAENFFTIVGRPQVADIEVVTAPPSGRPADRPPRVLYAPTWAGVNADSRYSSLAIGPAIVGALLARGCEVVYRPHPYTSRHAALRSRSADIAGLLAADARDHRRRHVFGPAAEQDWDLVDCFNAVDAMIADVSSVVPDFLYSEKPFALTAMGGPSADFDAEVPIARGGYVLAGDGSNLDAVLDDLLGADPQAAVRQELKAYYLGVAPPEGYETLFLTAARAAIA